VVIGGQHSNNTHELVGTCRKFCPRVFHVQTAADLRPEWFLNSETIGITAGTSTPDELINSVENWLNALAGTCPSAMAPRRAPAAAQLSNLQAA